MQLECPGSKTLIVSTKMYVAGCIKRSVVDYPAYARRMVQYTNRLLAVCGVPLGFSCNFEFDWLLPADYDPIWNTSKNSEHIPPELIAEDPNIPVKVFFCWLLSQIPLRTEDISVGFVGGRFRGIGGFSIRSLPERCEVMVFSFGNFDKDTMVFAHEVLHAVGLPHNPNPESLMHPRPSKFDLDESDALMLREIVRCKLIELATVPSNGE